MEGGGTMRPLTIGLLFASVVGGSVSAHAAMLTTGQGGNPANGSFGGSVCADVSNARASQGTPIQAFFCTGAQNQQFVWNGSFIYALGAQGCMDVSGGRTTDRTPVQFWTCNFTPAQQWVYDHGNIINLNSTKCLDATDLANGRQLIINTCDTNFRTPSQLWQIK
jgi:Ricin-type beta-trefoil lectin domain